MSGPLGTRTRDRLARPVVALYWLMLLGGLGLHAATAGRVLPLWIGAIAGTAFGHVLALRDLRLWFVALMTACVVYVGALFVPAWPSGVSALPLGLAFVPAVLCAYASLSDRWSLAACWFPAVLWMLSILDRTHGTTTVDAFGAVLLGALALAILAFLRAREARRVGLWLRVAPTPLAAGASPSVLRAPTGGGRALGAGWTLAVSTLAFALTAWLAPRLWQLEARRHPTSVARTGEGAGTGVVASPLGLPCCPARAPAETTRTRVREYLDLGRGHEATAAEDGGDLSCTPCPAAGLVAGGPITLPIAIGDVPDRVDLPGVDMVSRGPSGGGPIGGGEVMSAAPVVAPAPIAPVTVTPSPAPTPRPVAPIRPPVHAPVAPPVSQPAPIAPPTTIPEAPPPAPPPRPALPDRASAAPVVASTAPSPPMASAPASPPPAEAPGHGGALLRWLVTLLAFAAVFQGLTLGLRPLRRALTLRHLRNPLWPETVAQRVSNAWQLALVGLRDAGWRVGDGETPLALARRVNSADLERCATILERARYGLQLAADDVAQMSAAAHAAYTSARAPLSPVARAGASFRWPLA